MVTKRVKKIGENNDTSNSYYKSCFNIPEEFRNHKYKYPERKEKSKGVKKKIGHIKPVKIGPNDKTA